MSERPQAHVDRPSPGDLETAIHALHGIFWALNLFVTHNVADGVTEERDRLNAIDQLIMAGRLITDEISDRF